MSKANQTKVGPVTKERTKAKRGNSAKKTKTIFGTWRPTRIRSVKQ